MALSPKTQACLDEIERCVAEGYDSMAPALFSHCYGRAACSAAFRIARERKLIEVAYISAANTPVYRPYGMGKRIEEACYQKGVLIARGISVDN